MAAKHLVPLIFLTSILGSQFAISSDQATHPSTSQKFSECLQQSSSPEHGLTRLQAALANFTQTEDGRLLLAHLADGNWTLFPPVDSAFDTANITTFSPSTFSYHIVSGDFYDDTRHHNESDQLFIAAPGYPQETLGRTLLSDPTRVHLEGNHTQVIAWSYLGAADDKPGADDRLIAITSLGANTTIYDCTRCNNLFICPVADVLVPPANLTTVLHDVADEYKLQSFIGLLDFVDITLHDGSPGTAAQLFEETHGLTLFAPSNAAMEEATRMFSSTANDTNAFKNIILNHALNDSTAYSNFLSDSHEGQYTSAAGEPIHITRNSSGLFVVITIPTGEVVASAKIIHSDILLENGVMHIIDSVLLNMDSDPEAAVHAFESAESQAAEAAVETGAVGSGPAGTVNNAPALISDIGRLQLAIFTFFIGLLGWAMLG